MSTKKHHGTCYCGDVEFEVEVDITKGSQCNCTLCARLGSTGSIVKPAAFTLLTPEAKLASYARNADIGTRYFCSRCHVYCFGKGHLEMLGGDFVSVNLNCVDDFDLSKAELIHWDGRHDNWQAGPRPTRWAVTASV